MLIERQLLLSEIPGSAVRLASMHACNKQTTAFCCLCASRCRVTRAMLLKQSDKATDSQMEDMH